MHQTYSKMFEEGEAMKLVITLSVCLLIVLSGCISSLKVRKVSLDSRVCNTDHEIEGYRYYLSRPYIVVKEPVLVSEERHLVEGFHGTEKPPTTDKLLGKTVIKTGPMEVTQSEFQPMRQLIQEQANLAIENPLSQFDTVPSGVGTHLGVPSSNADANTVTDTVPLSGMIEVIFLPDMEEQYAIKDVNHLGKNAYSLKIRNGWELTDVSSEHDSTTVAIEILNVVDTAVNSAKTIATAGIDRDAKILTEALGTPASSGTENKDVRKDKESSVYHRVIKTYIKPGIYRINKPWEIQNVSPEAGSGFLQKLGLTLIEEEQIVEAKSIVYPEKPKKP